MLQERLVDDETEWGMTRVEYSMRQRRRIRELMRVRRALYLQRNVTIRERDERGRFVSDPPANDDGEVWMTPSGIRAYRKHVPNRVSLTSQPVYEATATKVVTLPWVSILGGRSLQHREG